MSSPNEPGYPRTGDAPGSANGSGGAPSSKDNGSLGNAAARGGNDVPPWQRGPANRAPRQPQRQAPEGGHNAGVDARLNRFIAGGSGSSAQAPSHEQDAPAFGERTETVRPESYASELPDLSGPTPRPAQPRKEQQRPASEPASRPAASSRAQVGTRHKGPVRASMQIRRIDPWSTLKVSLVLSVALFFVWMIAVAFLYLVLGGMGVWSKLNSNVGDLLTSAGGSSGGELVSSGTIFGGAALIGLVNIVLLTAMATCAAFIYNLTTDLVGGVEVTLADRD
ncbi:hypothetical protein A5724_10455 [Mycobacterium sp. ACS1612]|uniref:DUF3566 domain-containing protein n=1 Tax=Mycobacterium sp. ACS1612 TaxID=1834117 RepID=UPI000800915F|nr:DUF3566 domain-containing protein [Mycobacterium sp. ACS1612]OBF38145.1 hypothetical protein A5724_10455 [Mycobacterium sp. ACS1612]